MTWVYPLDAVSKDQVANCGSKGANLGELCRAGLPVPPGFVIAGAAYERFLQSGSHAKVPTEVAEEVLRTYRGLGGGPVAVRSSASFEDLPDASYAGQYHTDLNIRHEDDLVASVKRCWLSMWSRRALSYHSRVGSDQSDGTMALVVQRLIQAEVSGVMFTAHPLSGNPDQTVIEAAWGLGEAIVSGRVTPDQWVVDHRLLTVVDQRVARKKKQLVPTERGCELITVDEAHQSQPSLDSDQVLALAELGNRIAGHFGHPQDIEWAYADGQFWLLQARPITVKGCCQRL